MSLWRAAQVAGVLGLALLGAASGSAGEVTCRAAGVPLAGPPPLISTAVVRGSELLVAGGSSGLRRVDLASGRDLATISLRGHGPEEPVPMYLASGPGGIAVSGVNHHWYILDPSLNVTKTLSNAMLGPLGSCLLFDDRFVVYGFAREEKTGAGHAWLFVQYRDGGLVPLAEYEPITNMARHLGQFHIRQITQGGVCLMPGGGWVAVDPLDYTVRVFDRRDRQVGGFQSQNPHFKAPDVAAYPDGRWDPGDRTAYFAWLQAQCQVKRPVALGGDLIGVVVGIPIGSGRQRHELDVYRTDGTVVATAVPIPGLEVGRLIVADAEPGRLVVLTQERSWPFSAPATVWQVEVSGLPSPRGGSTGGP